MSETCRRQALGQLGEDLALQVLQARGYRVAVRNWRPGNAVRGEVDLVAWDGAVLCFVEVKTRVSNQRGHPQESVTRTKQRQLSALANAYVSLRKLDDVPCRFDVLEVWWSSDESRRRWVLHQNAFDYLPRARSGNGRSRMS